MPENYLEQARRHVVEGRMRIRRQQALIERHRLGSRPEFVQQSHLILDTMLHAQRLAEDHLALEEQQAAEHH